MSSMRSLYAYFTVIVLLVMSIASVAHADCANGEHCAPELSVTMVDNADTEHDGHKADVTCDCCATCGHHHHTHTTIFNTKSAHSVLMSKTHHSWYGDNYFSQLYNPPSKPPKA